MKYKFSLITAMLMTSLLVFAQDIIVTTDAQKIEAKILEVSKSEIKYKEIDNLDGPTFILETAEINSIIYSNGKVVLYNNATKPEEKQANTTTQTSTIEQQPLHEDNEMFAGLLQNNERKALIEYLNGYPKNIVAIKGDYSMLFNKKSKIYLDIDFDDAEKVTYYYEVVSYNEEGSFIQYLQEQLYAIEKAEILKSACDMFNKKMVSKKCNLLPITDLNSDISFDQNYYKMILHVQRIDVGIGALSVMTSGQTTTGGAIIYGNIEIKQAATDSLCSILIVDRVQGVGNAHEEIRIQHVIEEIIANKLFYIKPFKLYSKEL